jgi:hypothetical protein
MVDTLEGMARWRLPEERVRLNVRQTDAALRWLVEQGLIVQMLPAGLRSSVFRLNPSRLRDAKRFLAAKEQKRPQGGF